VSGNPKTAAELAHYRAFGLEQIGEALQVAAGRTRAVALAACLEGNRQEAGMADGRLQVDQAGTEG